MKIIHFIENAPKNLKAIVALRRRFKHLPIEKFHELLSDVGSLWIRCSDQDMDYLKIECDYIFGRENFVTHIIYPYEEIPFYDQFEIDHEFILVYAKNKAIWRPNLLPRTKKMDARYKNPDNDPRGAWIPSDLSVRTYSDAGDFLIKGPHGKIFKPPQSRSWSVNQEMYEHLLADNRIWFGKTGNARPMRKRFLSEVQDGYVSKTIWTADENPLEKILTLAANQNSTVLVL